MKPIRYTPWLWRAAFLVLVILELLVMSNLLTIKPTYTALGLLITVGSAWILLELIEHFLTVHHAHGVQWWMAILILAATYADALGDLFHYYAYFVTYDDVLHAVVPFIVSFCLLRVFEVIYPTIPIPLRSWLAITATISLSVLYELEEYSEDVLTGSNRMGDGFDTGHDLLMDVTGAVTAYLVLWLLNRKINGSRKTVTPGRVQPTAAPN